MAGIRRLWIVVLAAAFATACAPLPDVTPFSTATRELASAVRTSGDTAVSVIADVQDDDAQAEAFRTAWDARNNAMNALVRYSDGLVAIVQGFNDAKANAAKLGESVERLATATGLIAPGGGAAAGVAIDIANLVVEQIAKIKAAKSLERALTEAQPVVDAVAAHLGRRLVRSRAGAQPSNDITDLVAIYDAAESNIETEQVAATQPTADFITAVATRRAGLLRSIADGTPNAVAEAGQLGAATSAAEIELARLNEPFDERLTKVREARSLAEALAVAVDSWATAHADLVNAMKQRRPVSVDSLTQSAIEIRALVRRIKEL